jgi:stringent starvation protein B
MTPSTKPYLVRAIYEWCVDNGFSPYLAVTVDARTRVPRSYVKDGQIVLNIGSEASNGLTIGNDDIRFQARFNGMAQSLLIPLDRVSAIYARENGQGMAFEVEAAITCEAQESALVEGDLPGGQTDQQNGSGDTPTPPTSGRPHLTRVK